jgi:predicted enzyme related to lactoylglutathione lyase
MVTRDTAWPDGTPCWVDLGVEDIDQARTFYSALFGWEIPPGSPEFGGYTMAHKDGRAVAGIGPKQSPPEAPPAWTTYLATADADTTAKKIAEAGGALLLAPGDIGDAGRMAIAAGPGGATFGVWQARAHLGAELANEPGSLCWNENMSRDFEASKTFYSAVFDYGYDDMSTDDFTYATLKVGDNVVGGIGELVPDSELHAHWSVYFAVEDTDAAVAKVTELGGSVLSPAWDSPYGRMAVVSDDQGSVFSVMAVATPNAQG